MADLNIQRKKTAPSPWWLVLLAALLLAVAAYLFLRPDRTDKSAEVDGGPATAVADSLAPGSEVAQMRTLPPGDALPAVPEPADESVANATPATPEALAAQAATSPATADYALDGLQMLAATLVDLADRPDLRTAAIQEQRDNLTSATSRLNVPNAPLRAGFVAAASLLQAMQQQAYPNLETSANDLVQLAASLTGHNATPTEQQQNQQFLTQAAALVKNISQPAP